MKNQVEQRRWAKQECEKNSEPLIVWPEDVSIKVPDLPVVVSNKVDSKKWSLYNIHIPDPSGFIPIIAHRREGTALLVKKGAPLAGVVMFYEPKQGV